MARNFKKSNKGITFKPQGSTPTNPTNGDIYYDSAAGKFKFRENGAWNEIGTGGGGGMTNPMTTAGDMIIGGASGTPTRLGIGDEGAVLTVSSGTPTWVGGTPPVMNGIAVFGGGTTGSESAVIDTFNINTAGNATSFGSLTVARSSLGATSSTTRGIFFGSDLGGGVAAYRMDYVTLATAGNATTFGSTINNCEYSCAGADNTRAVFNVGYPTQAYEYITMATTGNSTSFGSMASPSNRYAVVGTSNNVLGLFFGGTNGAAQTAVDVVTIQTTANATNFGNLSTARSLAAASGDGTRAIVAAGGNWPTPVNTIEYFTYASGGTGASFGTMSSALFGPAATSNSTKAVIGGGTSSSTIDQLTIQTTGNTTNFGSLTVARAQLSACSDSHGGTIAYTPPPPGRAVLAGNYSNRSLTIEYTSIATLGNTSNFGNTTTERSGATGTSSSTRGLFAGGYNGAYVGTQDYVTIATTGNATLFGNLNAANRTQAGMSNNTLSVLAGGTGIDTTLMQYVTIATLGNVSTFGNCGAANEPTGLSSPVRGVLTRGSSAASTEYIVFATTSNSAGFGSLSTSNIGQAACSSSTRGIINSSGTTLEYITIATAGNSINFGALGSSRSEGSGTSNGVRGLFVGGGFQSMEYVTIATTGSGTFFGNMLASTQFNGACSDSHGGIS